MASTPPLSQHPRAPKTRRSFTPDRRSILLAWQTIPSYPPASPQVLKFFFLSTGSAPADSSSFIDNGYNWSALTPPNELSTLPTAPAFSPPFSPEPQASLEPPISAKARGKRREVDEGNIVATRRTRVRRIRSSDNLIGNPLRKKITVRYISLIRFVANIRSHQSSCLISILTPNCI
jgi:hypothetical protein